MSASFELDHAKLAADPRLSGIARELDALGPIDSRESFNRYCREACRLWNRSFADGIGEISSRFDELLARVERGGKEIIQTPWGGVVIEKYEPPLVEKYLVIRQGGYLALETHELKDERLEVSEGAGLILWRNTGDQPLKIEELVPGGKFHFPPGAEHCIIGTENLLVFERSTDPKGMDQDLIFIYEPD